MSLSISNILSRATTAAQYVEQRRIEEMLSQVDRLTFPACSILPPLKAITPPTPSSKRPAHKHNNNIRIFSSDDNGMGTDSDAEISHVVIHTHGISRRKWMDSDDSDVIKCTDDDRGVKQVRMRQRSNSPPIDMSSAPEGKHRESSSPPIDTSSAQEGRRMDSSSPPIDTSSAEEGKRRQSSCPPIDSSSADEAARPQDVSSAQARYRNGKSPSPPMDYYQRMNISSAEDDHPPMDISDVEPQRSHRRGSAPPPVDDFKSHDDDSDRISILSYHEERDPLDSDVLLGSPISDHLRPRLELHHRDSDWMLSD
ncbi:unnamed protein product [Sympodiomycopsis kandeliae]